MSPTEKPTIPEFGRRLDGVHYIDRPSVYAVIENAEGQIAVIEFDHDHFLPGGGKMPGESDKAALIREIREETGYSGVIHENLGEAVEYLQSVSDGKYYRIHGRYYKTTLGEKVGESIEPDHRFIWLLREEAIKKLTRKGHVWGITKFVN